jgi:hypothetical protein
MFKKVLVSLFLLGNATLGLAKQQGQVNLVGPVAVHVKAGESSWSAKISQPIQVNPLQILFWNTSAGRCPKIPITSVSVKYTNDLYWYNAMPRDGYYYIENRFLVEAVKLDFYLDGTDETCVITVSGFRDIAEPSSLNDE